MASLDKPSLKQIREQIDEALSLLSIPGIKVSLGNCRFTPDNATFKLEVAVVGKGGTVMSKEASDLKMLATSFGLPADVLGRKFGFQGKTFEVTGCKPRSYKMPILAKNVATGKTFKFAPDTVTAFLIPK